MPLTPEQLDNWFTYHAPTPETGPKYLAIREAEIASARPIVAILNGSTIIATHDEVNAACRAFAEAIDANVPDSADKSAAIRCVRLARNAANEAIVTMNHERREAGHVAWERPSRTVVTLCREAESELRRARWQANSAIACGGK